MGFTIYEATRNSDLTEGRGRDITIGLFTDLEEAVKCVQGQGVMGQGAGEVYEVKVDDELLDYGESVVRKEIEKKKVWGYRKSVVGKWGYGYIDNRDEEEIRNSDDFKQFIALADKFGVKVD